MNFCFVRQVILRWPCPNAERVQGSANWSLAASIVQTLERIWTFIASQFICLISGFPMIQKLDCFIEYMEWQKFKWPATQVARYLIMYSNKKGISSKIWMNKYESEFIFIHSYFGTDPFFIISLLKAYDGCTIPSPNIEIESRYFRRTKIPAYPAVLRCICLHIRSPTYLSLSQVQSHQIWSFHLGTPWYPEIFWKPSEEHYFEPIK